MIVHFVDIGGIVDHHCLNFLFIIKGLPPGGSLKLPQQTSQSFFALLGLS